MIQKPTHWLTSSSLLNLSLTGASISCCTWALSNSSRWGVITWSTHTNTHICIQKVSGSLVAQRTVFLKNTIFCSSKEQNNSVSLEISSLSSWVYLQSKLFQLSRLVQQLSSELSQQQLQFLLLSLSVAQQALQFTLSPGELILQAAKKRTPGLSLSRVRYLQTHESHGKLWSMTHGEKKNHVFSPGFDSVCSLMINTQYWKTRTANGYKSLC